MQERTMNEKMRNKCKDCHHAQKCCRGNFLCRIRNYERRHVNRNACAQFESRNEQNNV